MVANRDFHYIFKRLKSAIAEKQQVVCKLHKPKKVPVPTFTLCLKIIQKSLILQFLNFH